LTVVEASIAAYRQCGVDIRIASVGSESDRRGAGNSSAVGLGRAGFRGMLAKLERIEEIWLPQVGKDLWTIGQYVWEFDSGLYRRDAP
jgi:hypothetical protein